MKQEVVEGSLVRRAHELVAEAVRGGDTVVDATVGNGHDTLFLARCVGGGGKVVGFDVQAQSLVSAEALFGREGVSRQPVCLHGVGHENMVDYVSEPVAAVMFNLGYLPGSDKVTITRKETTLEALGQAAGLLKPGGCLSVMCYPGHPGGREEADAVSDWFGRMGGVLHPVTCYRRAGAKETAPFLIVARKAG